jgi:hypothetical protein
MRGEGEGLDTTPVGMRDKFRGWEREFVTRKPMKQRKKQTFEASSFRCFMGMRVENPRSQRCEFP